MSVIHPFSTCEDAALKTDYCISHLSLHLHLSPSLPVYIEFRYTEYLNLNIVYSHQQLVKECVSLCVSHLSLHLRLLGLRVVALPLPPPHIVRVAHLGIPERKRIREKQETGETRGETGSTGNARNKKREENVFTG